MKKVRLKKRFYAFAAVLVLAIAAATWFGVAALTAGDGDENPGPAQKPDPISLSLTVAGDIILHESNLESAYNPEDGSYSYDDCFAPVKSIIEGSDLAFCTIETTFAGPPYNGYPTFRGPDGLATSLAATGFDVVMTASNHAYDAGLSGMTRTVTVLQDNGILAAGTRADTEAPRYAIKEVKGIKIAMIAYTYETGGGSDPATYLNANPLSDEAAALVNSFNYNKLDEDIAEMKETAEAARAAGADLVLFYFHWGNEYQRTYNSHQENIAQRVAEEAGADFIFASHPHVPQGTGVVTVGSTDSEGVVTEREVPVYYALGNLLSNQRREFIPSGGRFVEEGYMVTLNLTFDGETHALTAREETRTPYWVDRYQSGGRLRYAIIPLTEGFEQSPILADSGHLSLARQALEDLQEIPGL